MVNLDQIAKVGHLSHTQGALFVLILKTTQLIVEWPGYLTRRLLLFI